MDGCGRVVGGWGGWKDGLVGGWLDACVDGWVVGWLGG